jgi:hypothetical protein
MSIRFKSVLNGDKWGYEYTNDSMTFWDTSYRHGGCLHGACGYYETLGDGTTQHSVLMPCRAEHFTDYLLSIVRHLLANPSEEISAYQLEVVGMSKENAEFLAGVVYKEDRRQWLNKVTKKVTSNKSKEHDKRWIQVPTWADGTMASVAGLYTLEANGSGTRMRELLPMYSLHASIESHLYASAARGADWDKMTAYREEIVGDHSAAHKALEQWIIGREALRHARNLCECCESNSKSSVAEVAA